MATHSSILAWRIPQTEEPGRLQSMGSKESDTVVVTNTFTHWTSRGFPSGSDGKESACNAGDLSSFPVSGRSPGVRKW